VSDHPEHPADASPQGLNAAQIELLVREMDDLPTLPEVIRRLVELTSAGEGEAVLEPAAEVIACDPGLTVRFLRQSAGAGEGTVSIPQAVRRTGAQAIRSLALSMGASAQPTPGQGAAAKGLDRRGFWLHSLASAWAARLLVERSNLPLDPPEAFLAGLLHDMGKLAMDHLMPKSYAKVLEGIGSFDGNIADQERRIIGVDHTVVGRRLAEQWRLPKVIMQAIWMHHQPPEALPQTLADRTLVVLVGLADMVARQVRLGFSGNHTFTRTTGQIAATLNIPARTVEEVLRESPLRLEESLDALGLNSPTTALEAPTGAATIGAELGKLNEALRRQVESCAAGAEAMRRLADLASAIRPDSTVAEALVGIAGVFLAAKAEGPAAGAVVAYSIYQNGGRMVLAVRCDGSAPPHWRTIPCGRSFDPARPVGPEAPATEAVAGLLGEPGALSGWLDLTGYAHYPLTCRQRWIGGVFCPAGADLSDGDSSTRRALTGVLGWALAIVQGRSQAVLLSEQLAGASQVLARTHDALAQARTLATTGEMASGAAHEINTPLAVISGRAQLMRDRSKTEEERKVWQLIADQAQRISDIITDLMDLTSPPPPKPRRLDAGKLLKDAADAFSAEHPQALPARVDIDTAEPTPPVWADAGQIARVLVELMTNAANAAQGPTAIHLSARADQTAHAVLLLVHDDGPGMDEATQARAFTPFFSRQEAGRRRGLGLARAQRYVENNGGRIRIDSSPGAGTTVIVELPAAEEPDPAEEPTDGQAENR
jgi:signal transduction histidine kinase/HD-like signal output (HDOD) protein